MNDEFYDCYIRPKRSGLAQWKWKNMIYIPCPLPIKNKFRTTARLNGLNESQLGLIIVDEVISSELWLNVMLESEKRRE